MQRAIERGFFKSEFSNLKLNDVAALMEKPDVQVLRIGRFNHPKYGEFEITKQTLIEMKENFDNKVRGVDIAFDYFHNSDQEAAGWPTELYLTENGEALWAKVDWTPIAHQKLSDREIRYFSPDFAFEWKDPESGKVYKNVLFGGGLTNRPFVKDMAAIVAHEEREKMELKELQEKVVKLAEDGEDLKKAHADLLAKHEELKKAHSDLQKKMAEDGEEGDDSAEEEGEGDKEETDEMKSLKAELADAKKKLMEYAEAKKLAEKETAFNLLLSEGKVCVAQKDAYLKDNMSEFIKLSQPVNLSGHGASTGNQVEGGDRDEKVLKLAEEMCKKDAKLSKVDAISLANKELK